MIKKYFSSAVLFSITIFICAGNVFSQEKSDKPVAWSIKAADSFIAKNPGGVITYDTVTHIQKWDYEQGLMLSALYKMYQYTGNEKYYDYVKQNLDCFIDEKGNIATYKFLDYNIDNINPGKAILYLYQITGEEKYKIAADTLRKQLGEQPRTPGNGFWHKKRYPNQMWLDGLYMGEPFYAEYTKLFGDAKDFDDITHQFLLIYEHTYDLKTGLLYHAWDESKQQKWANPETGLSPHFWGRAMGWYLMAIVDVLDYIPKDHKDRNKLIEILKTTCEALLKFRDPERKVWRQVLDQGNREGNYTEASATLMFAYAFARGYNMGYLPENFIDEAKISFEGALNEFVRIDKDGFYDLFGTCRGAGLGGDPYRDGTYEYYISEPQRKNDFKGFGPFILAALELEKATADFKCTKVVLDNYFNNERRTTKVGTVERYHYIWDDTTNSGFYELGEIFKKNGAKVSELIDTPTKENLGGASVYIIVDPDTPKENPEPKYIDDNSIEEITKWVSNGGTLLLMANDAGNCEFEHLNKLASQFGFHFNEVSLNRVEGKNYEMGAFTKLPFHPFFYGLEKIYMKEISTITVEKPQYIILKKDNEAAIAFCKYGKGAVVAIGDPWLYNEYIDNRRLPESFENYRAAENLVSWLLRLSQLNKIGAGYDK
ncbi:MAG: glycoside hydrolase family 88 protein [bacterium]